ncbi:hypothetical protein RI129_004321 [Pyrocoelia pectoralis]|uniref:CCHC-type domain-containing protein n=1 Tax=Pyrocoelia pectoralis TaxID=417401 RepID=A0AAN7ZJ67_9COLE
MVTNKVSVKKKNADFAIAGASSSGEKKYEGKKSNSAGCYKCGSKHEKGKCYAYNKFCNHCGQIGHFAVVCRNKRGKVQGNDHFRRTKVHDIEQAEDDLVINDIEIGTVDSSGYYEKEKDWIVTVYIADYVIKLKKESEMKQVKHYVVSYGGNNLNVSGDIVLRCFIGNKSYKIRFIVVKFKGKPLLGLNSCIKLHLIRRIEIENVHTQFKDDKSAVVIDDRFEDNTLNTSASNITCATDEQIQNDNSVVTTRLGRVVRKPLKLNDYSL